ncbi:Ran-binding protein 1-like b, partial [Mucuna pruriens]
MDNNADHRQEDEAPAAGDDEDTGALVAPIVRLEEVAVSTGEEDEEPLLNLKAKLYRFDKNGSQWKERGAGTVKFLKHNVTGKVRLLVRQSKTLKICANHRVGPGMSVQEHAGSEKSCVWHATDFADGELKDELFCIRFLSIENCRKFMEKFEEIAESQNNEENQGNGNKQINGDNQNNKENQNNGNKQINGGNQNNEGNKKNGENQDACGAAGLLEKLSVEEHATVRLINI